MEYRAHGLPLQNQGTRAYSFIPIAETLSKIGRVNGLDTVIVFNVGAHFVLYDPDVFLDRLATIRRALDSLKKTCP